jgi:HEAT repeat protein
VSEEFDAEQIRVLLRSSDEEDRRRALADIPEGWTAGTLAVLIDAMGDPSWRVRKDAVARIARWPDPDGAVPMLIATLVDDSNVGLRNAAVEALAAIGRPSVGPLGTALEAGGDHRKFLIDALGAIGDRSAVNVLVRRLDDPDENVRAAAAEALGNLGGADAVSALRKRLSGADLLGRLAAIEALNRLGAQVPVAELLPMLSQPILRRAVLEALGHSGDLAALPMLAEGIVDRTRGVREASAVALCALHAGQKDEGLRSAIEDAVRARSSVAMEGLIFAVSADAVGVRRAAVSVLGWGRWPEALPRLVDALRDEEIHDATRGAIVAYGAAAVEPLSQLVREAGQELRSEIIGIFPRLGAEAGSPRVTALLTRALDDEDPAAAAAAARALGEVGGKEALGALFHALGRTDDVQVPQAASVALGKLGRRFYDEVRMLIGARGLETGVSGVFLCRVLGMLGRAEDRPLLLGALKTDTPALRRAAVEALGVLGPASESREALSYALADEDAHVRASAAEALGSLGDPEAVLALVHATSDDVESVRIAATRALGALGDRRAAPALREMLRAQTGILTVHAVESLGRLRPGTDGDPEEVFLEILSHKDPEVVKAAICVLAARQSAKSTAGLVTVLGHAKWDVRRQAAQSLASRISVDPVAVRALEVRLAGERDALVREAIAMALEGRAA